MTHKEIFKIRTSECDKNMKIIPSAILDLFQETAGRHCLPSRMDSPSLIKDHNATWVLTGMALEFNELPSWPEEIEVETWAKSLTGFKAFRDYKILNSKGSNIINGSSIWALINLETRRPVKIDSIASVMKINSGINSMEINPGKFNLENNLEFNESTIIVTKSDLDMNDHVSNIQYITWLHNHSNKDFLNKYELKSLNISYKGECYLGDELLYKSSVTPLSGSHIFVNKKTNKEVCTISSGWKETSI